MKKLIEDKRKEYSQIKGSLRSKSVVNSTPRSFIMSKVDNHFNKKITEAIENKPNMP